LKEMCFEVRIGNSFLNLPQAAQQRAAIARGGPKIKCGAADLPRRRLADKFLHIAIVPANAYQHTKFQLPSSISFRDTERVQKFNVGATSPLPCPVR